MTVLSVVLPVFALIALGFVAAKRGIIPEAGIGGLSAFVFNIAIPALLFRAGTRVFQGAGFDGDVTAAFFAGAMVAYVLGLLIGRFIFRLPLAEQTIIATGGGYSNNVMIGIPLASLVFGEQGILLATGIIALSGATFYALAAILIETGRSGRIDIVGVLRSIVRGLVRNPIVMGMALGILWGATGVPLPEVAERFINLLASAAAPAALFALGASLTRFDIAGDLAQSGTMTALKLLVHPAAAWVIGSYGFGLAPIPLAVMTLYAALPIGANVFLLAGQYGLGERRASAAVVISTVVSVLTLTALVALLANPA